MKTGWLVSYDREAAEEGSDFCYQPWVQTEFEAYCIEVWFQTQQECEDFIRNKILGLGMYD